MHRLDDVGSGWDLTRISRIVSEHDDVIGFVVVAFLMKRIMSAQNGHLRTCLTGDEQLNVVSIVDTSGKRI